MNILYNLSLIVCPLSRNSVQLHLLNYSDNYLYERENIEIMPAILHNNYTYAKVKVLKDFPYLSRNAKILRLKSPKDPNTTHDKSFDPSG